MLHLFGMHSPILSYMPRTTPMVMTFVFVSIGFFLGDLTLSKFFGLSLIPFLGLIPSRVGGGWVWQLVTYSLLHGSLMHILFNLFVVWGVGSELEILWGKKVFSLFSLTCIVGAALFHLFFALMGWGGAGPNTPVIGSSGLVFGLLLAFAIFYGDRLLYFAGIFPLQARYFVIILIALELISSIFYGNDGVSHFAHMGGMVFGFVFLALLAGMRRRNSRKGLLGGTQERKKPRKNPGHLRLVEDKENFDDPTPKHWN